MGEPKLKRFMRVSKKLRFQCSKTTDIKRLKTLQKRIEICIKVMHLSNINSGLEDKNSVPNIPSLQDLINYKGGK